MDMKILGLLKEYAHKNGLPCIPLKNENIEIISTPHSFYESIINGISRCKNRITLSALYLGVGKKEEAIVYSVCERIKACHELDFRIVLDKNRASRSFRGQSSLTTLNSCLKLPRSTLDLFQCDQEYNIFQKFVAKNFSQLAEIMSTYHGKLAIFDDDILITGANLSQTYFDNRQDRYMLLRESKHLAKYFSQFFDRVLPSRPLKQAIEDYNVEFVHNVLPMIDKDRQSSFTYAIPIFQHGPSGITDKEDFLNYVKSILDEKTQIYLSSGYFNPSREMLNIHPNKILIAREEANGFYGAKGILGYVPRFYSAILRNYLNVNPNCDPRLYSREDWSFHAKGIWIEDENFAINVIGSSNFNYRSSKRDFEMQLIIVTNNQDLMKSLREERESLWENSRSADQQYFQNVNPLVNVLLSFVKSYL